MRNEMIGLLGLAFAGLFLNGCGTGRGAYLTKLPDNDAAFFRQKIEPALASTNCIKEMQVLMLNTNKYIAIITLNAEPKNAENDCLKTICSLSRDPLTPNV